MLPFRSELNLMLRLLVIPRDPQCPFSIKECGTGQNLVDHDILNPQSPPCSLNWVQCSSSLPDAACYAALLRAAPQLLPSTPEVAAFQRGMLYSALGSGRMKAGNGVLVILMLPIAMVGTQAACGVVG